MNEPQWIQQQALVLLHSASLAEFGGLEGIRDPGLLESALNRPRNKFTYHGDACDLCDLAAAYGFGLAKNHLFHDGNKRMAFLAMGLFLGINGYDLIVPQTLAIQTMLTLAAGQLTEQSLTAWIREHAKPSDPPQE